MDGLRWLLLFFGILVIAGVYFYSRRERNKAEEEPAPEQRLAPTLGEEPEPVLAEEIAEPAETISDEPAAKPRIVTLRLIARDGGAFKGDELVLSMRGIGLRHGKFGIFHRYDGNDEERTVFSAASLVEPGSFDLANIADQELPGISLFLVLPGPIDSVDAFDMMMEAARTLTQALDGELLDESGSTLSIQRERYMREEVIQYQHSNIVAE
ncbi:MAG: cell division protein ZipA [Gammaproteobacteria bacterium]|nr:cell division protein ZipA [Gammaproteobacteria bacterium]